MLVKTLDAPFPDSGRDNSRISYSGAVDMECLNRKKQAMLALCPVNPDAFIISFFLKGGCRVFEPGKNGCFH